MKQCGAKLRFEGLDLLAYGGLRQTQFFGSEGKARLPRGGFKRPEPDQRRQYVRAGCHKLNSVND